MPDDDVLNTKSASARETASDELDRLKTALAKRYAIERELGRGGMATVYVAQDLKHGRKVAVKVLHPKPAETVGTERFLREIEIASGLTHPNIVPLYDSGAAGGFLYFVMPYIEGENLRQLLNRKKRIPLEDARRIAGEVAGALSYAHRQSIVHRDIKPENILLADGKAVVADFGISKAICDACPDNITLSGSGSVGTPAYMSPEQALGEEVDPRTDVYSLGCVLYEMLTGEPPYRGPNVQATMARHAAHPIPSVSQLYQTVPEAIDAVLKRALAKDKTDRFESAEQFAEALRGGSLQDAVVGRSTRASPPRGRRIRSAFGAVLLAGLVAALFGWWRFSASVAGTGTIESLAVLPFANLSGDADQEYFVDGMHDALIAELAQIRAFTLISRTSVMRYRQTVKSVPEIGRELNVDAILEGSVFRTGDSVRITAQLIRVTPERHLWAQTYAGDLGNVLRLHSEVAQAIARAVGAELTPQTEARFAAVGRVNPEAHDAFLLGRFHHAKGTVTGFRTAIDYYEQAIEKAPTFARAHAALALSTHLLGVYGGLRAHETEPRAKAAALRALELDGALAEARAVLAGITAMYDWDWTGAERAYQQALELDPSSAIAHQWYAYHLSSMGRHDEAVAEARRGLELDPLNPMGRIVVADQFAYSRQYEQAIGELQSALDLDPGFDRARALIEWNYTQLGRYDDAVALRRERLTRTDPEAARGSEALEVAYAASGARGYWRWQLERLQSEAVGSYVAPSEVAAVYAALGEKDTAFQWLERAYEERQGMEMLRVWPGYDSLRSDARFADLLRRLNFPE